MSATTSYTECVKRILATGETREDRTGTGTISLFGERMVFRNIANNFPAVTEKWLWFKGVIHELVWMLSGDTNIKYLNDNGVKIWDPWAKDGELGPVYGKQWRSFEGVDQIEQVIASIKSNPYSRRHIVSAWNPADLDAMALPPCHLLFQFQVSNGRLNCQLYQRSADMFLGVPFNIASYSLLTMAIAEICGLVAGDFTHVIGDAHIYLNHVDQVKIMLDREPLPPPKVTVVDNPKSISDISYESFLIENYRSHPKIKGKIAV